MRHAVDIPGSLVAFPPKGRARVSLDGFLSRGRRRSETLLIYVHGMGSNFYRSRLKKAFLSMGPRAGFDVLSFNNRGAEDLTLNERFEDGLDDISGALAFARDRGYKRAALAGHSTGCQKIVHHQAVRHEPMVRGLALLAIGDDYAITRAESGPRFARNVRKARHMIEKGRGGETLPGQWMRFSARRYLSIADPQRVEASLFDMNGPLRHFRRVSIPVLAVMPGADEFLQMPAAELLLRLRKVTTSQAFASWVVPGADHGFHGHEEWVARRVFRWMKSL